MHVYASLPPGQRSPGAPRIGGCSCPGLYLPLNTIRPYPFIQFVLENRAAGGKRRQDFEINVVLRKLLSILLATKPLKASPRSVAARLRDGFFSTAPTPHGVKKISSRDFAATNH
jgi:hypothetical protein